MSGERRLSIPHISAIYHYQSFLAQTDDQAPNCQQILLGPDKCQPAFPQAKPHQVLWFPKPRAGQLAPQ
jgi:hypothetical protein